MHEHIGCDSHFVGIKVVSKHGSFEAKIVAQFEKQRFSISMGDFTVHHPYAFVPMNDQTVFRDHNITIFYRGV